MTLVGLEPTISGSVDRCLIHWATGPFTHVSIRVPRKKLQNNSNHQPTTGIEPATFCLRSRRSTAKLHWRVATSATTQTNEFCQKQKKTFTWMRTIQQNVTELNYPTEKTTETIRKTNKISCFFQKNKNSAAGTRTRVARVKAEYPNQLDYSGHMKFKIYSCHI